MSTLTKEELNDLFQRFIYSLSVSDHMGDVAECMDRVLKRLGHDFHFDNPDDLTPQLSGLGWKGLWAD